MLFSHELRRLLLLGLMIIAGLGLGGCDLTRDLWKADNPNGRQWTWVPVSLEQVASGKEQS